jgi:hypothetical protein
MLAAMTAPIADLHFVYISRLAPGHDAAVFDDICRVACSNNPERSLAGVLLFDGQRFAHWLHGPRDAVRQLMGLIALDPRHTALSVRLEAMLPALDPDPAWRMGRVASGAFDAFAALPCDDAATLLEGLDRLIEQAQLAPPLPVAALRAARAKPGSHAAP